MNVSYIDFYDKTFLDVLIIPHSINLIKCLKNLPVSEARTHVILLLPNSSLLF